MISKDWAYLLLVISVKSFFQASIPGTSFNVFSDPVFLTHLRLSSSQPHDSEVIGHIDLKIVSFNLLAPCYKCVYIERNDKGTKSFESEFEDLYLQRNSEICDQLLKTDADVLCLQEFWSLNYATKALFEKKLCGSYTMNELRRTNHWRPRQDALAIFTKQEKIVVQDIKEILFHDCGDRVAQLMLLAVKSQAISLSPSSVSRSQGINCTELPMQQFLCLNTHLLFPHNNYSSKIRMREMTKVLGFVELYRQKDLCSGVCSRSDVRLPVIIAGDFNGSPQGMVYKYVRSQNYRSAQEEVWQRLECGAKGDVSTHVSQQADAMISRSRSGTDSTVTYLSPEGVNQEIEIDLKGGVQQWNKSWISHKTHRNQLVAVDHVFFSNPSEQVAHRLPPVPDWTELVFRELRQRISEKFRGRSVRDVFSAFDVDGTECIDRREFELALKQLGFQGEGDSSPALTQDEVQVLVDSADKNGDGLIDYGEFCDRFWLADELLAEDVVDDDTSASAAITSGIPFTEQSTVASLENLPARAKATAKEERVGVFARSTWLTRPTISRLRDENPVARIPRIPMRPLSTSSAEDGLDADTAEQLLIDLDRARPMGDLKVMDLRMHPSEVQMGVWPTEYTLSDHAMVEVWFRGVALGPVSAASD